MIERIQAGYKAYNGYIFTQANAREVWELFK